MVENVLPAQVWEALNEDPEAQLVDVRTDAEWAYVGVPGVGACIYRRLQFGWSATLAAGGRIAGHPEIVFVQSDAVQIPRRSPPQDPEGQIPCDELAGIRRGFGPAW
jgi:rhodanese-related sulfurtransferase